MQDSVFKSGLRAFFITLFAILGLLIGILLITAIFSFAPDTTSEATLNYTPQIVANAEGKRTVLSKDTPVILKLNVEGIIGLDSLDKNTIREQLIESREGTLKDDRVKALLLHINSPGGTVVDADGIYHAVKAYKDQYKVPVYAYIDGLCASGGMYIAVAADEIYASDVSMIGSIGVLSPSFINVSQLLDKIGVQSLTLTAGKGKDDLNPLRPWKPGESDNIKSLIDHYYQMFVNIVTTNRPQIDKEKLINDYGAKVFNAVQAKEYGYIDANGLSYNDVLRKLVAKIGVKDNNYQVMEFKKKSWFSELFSSESTILKGKITHYHQLQLSADLDSKLMNKFLYLYRPE